ncbi:8386_t:CDS:2 [Racocetra fulgida]|uniref:8386_t:CDS:1 n=1 Tax=Racocetra fulgida TaxID=60492 RepID=A0A9N9B0H9_9GLOM|nr:8386_t:CDS:2 [Racocetra fulgida]
MALIYAFFSFYDLVDLASSFYVDRVALFVGFAVCDCDAQLLYDVWDTPEEDVRTLNDKFLDAASQVKNGNPITQVSNNDEPDPIDQD